MLVKVYVYHTHEPVYIYIYTYEYDWICIYAYIEVIMMSSCNYYPFDADHTAQLLQKFWQVPRCPRCHRFRCLRPRLLNSWLGLEGGPPKPGFAHTKKHHIQTIWYTYHILSPEDEWKHWLYAVILTFEFSGFWVLIPNRESVGFQSLGPGTGDMKMHAPKNRNSPGNLLEPFAVGLQSWANLGFRVLGFRVLGLVVLESKTLKAYAGICACQRICGIRPRQT